MKLVVNMIMGSFMAASAEGLELAKGVGLRDEDLIEVVNMAAIATPMFKLKVWPHRSCNHSYHYRTIYWTPDKIRRHYSSSS